MQAGGVAAGSTITRVYSRAGNPDQNHVRMFETYPRQIFEHPSKYRKTSERHRNILHCFIIVVKAGTDIRMFKYLPGLS